MRDLSPTIKRMANATITLQRKSGGSYDADGKWIGEIISDITGVSAVVQPATGDKLNDLSEGERSDAQFFLWMSEDLALDDVVIYAGANHRVVHLWSRQSDGGFTRAAIGRMR